MAQSEKTNKLNMLLALALAERKRADRKEQVVCPDAETIACYFDGQLSPTEKEQFLQQLRVCPESYKQWLATAEALGYAHEASLEINMPDGSVSWGQQLRNWFSSSHKVLTAAAVACFSLVVVVNLNFQQIPLEQQLSEDWQENRQLYLAHMDVSEYLDRRQTKSTLTIVPFSDKTAFGRGFKSGLELIYKDQRKTLSDPQELQEMQSLIDSLPDNTLPCKTERCEVETSVNRQLGTWSAFLTQQCQQISASTELNKSYWQRQKDMFQRFEQEYEQLERRFGVTGSDSKNLRQRLKNLKPSFSQLPDHVTQACVSMNQLVLHALQN